MNYKFNDSKLGFDLLFDQDWFEDTMKQFGREISELKENFKDKNPFLDKLKVELNETKE